MVSLEWKSKGNVVRKKLLGILLAKGQEDVSDEEEKRLSNFLFIRKASRNI